MMVISFLLAAITVRALHYLGKLSQIRLRLHRQPASEADDEDRTSAVAS